MFSGDFFVLENFEFIEDASVSWGNPQPIEVSPKVGWMSWAIFFWTFVYFRLDVQLESCKRIKVVYIYIYSGYINRLQWWVVKSELKVTNHKQTFKRTSKWSQPHRFWMNFISLFGASEESPCSGNSPDCWNSPRYDGLFKAYIHSCIAEDSM